jgi:hypothetical protein
MTTQKIPKNPPCTGSHYVKGAKEVAYKLLSNFYKLFIILLLRVDSEK